MKEQLIQEVQRQMLPYLNNAQLKQLQGVLEGVLSGVELSHSAGMVESAKVDTVACFINAKRIEGCSEKTLSYYRQTIMSMLSGIDKEPQEIATEDLRKYLTEYQANRKSSKVTIDNIRRILSSYFSWLEDEDYIVKSPVRRIHKVKTAKVIKETYTDEALEIMRDNCCNVRDLAMIDLLASSGMRVGEMVALRLLGDFIRQVDVRNTDGKEENLLGVSVQKMFIPSIANTVGTDFTKYKVVKRGQFTYIPDTSRRGDKIGIALLTDYDEGLVSNIYTVFEVKDENELLPEYLMLWFSRPEFDRYARFKSHGSVREIMDWDEMCKVKLPVPSIEKQRSIVKAYNTITDRIELKRKINDNLAA